MDAVDQAPGAEKPESRWFARHWKWTAAVILTVLVVGAVLLFYIFIGRGQFLDLAKADMKVKASEPYRMTLEQLRNEPEVVERLGEPIEQSGFASGEVNSAGGRGDASFRFDVTGPNGSASVSAQARMIDSQWGLSRVEVTFDDGNRINVRLESSETLEEAPRWPP